MSILVVERDVAVDADQVVVEVHNGDARAGDHSDVLGTWQTRTHDVGDQ